MRFKGDKRRRGDGNCLPAGVSGPLRCVHALSNRPGGAKGAPAAGEAMSDYAARVQRGGGIKLDEARQILNIEENATREEVDKVMTSVARIPPRSPHVNTHDVHMLTQL